MRFIGWVLLFLFLLLVNTVKAHADSGLKSTTEWEAVAISSTEAWRTFDTDGNKVRTLNQALSLKLNKTFSVPSLGYSHIVTYGLRLATEIDRGYPGIQQSEFYDIYTSHDGNADFKKFILGYDYTVHYNMAGSYASEFSISARKSQELSTTRIFAHGEAGYNNDQFDLKINSSPISVNTRGLFYKVGLYYAFTSYTVGIYYRDQYSILSGASRIARQQDNVGLYTVIKF